MLGKEIQIMNNILIVSELRSYFTISLEDQLQNAGFHVLSYGADISKMNMIQSQINGILIYADETLLKNKQVFIYVRDRALEENIPIFVIGDSNEIATIRSLISRNFIKKEFTRPIDIKNVVSEMEEYIELFGNDKKKKILVVDDSGAMLRNVKGWLEESYQVILANSGAMAIKYLSTNKPDLVLLDYEMPVINGKQVLEMIRTERDFSDIPVIFLTGKNDRESILKLVKSAIEYANLVVYEKSKESQDLENMGTTIDICLIIGNKVYIGHVGDSRVYRKRRDFFRKLTTDHSYVQKLVSDGTITKEEAYNHPKKNMLIKALGCSSYVEPDVMVKGFLKDDVLLMCSDGLTNMLKDEKIVDMSKRVWYIIRV